jgi:hypothetical protein
MLKRFRVINNKIEAAAENKSQIMVFITPDDKEKRLLIDQ